MAENKLYKSIKEATNEFRLKAIKEVKDAFKKLKEDIEKDPSVFIHEYTIVARLYYHICKIFEEKNQSDGFRRLRLEYKYEYFGSKNIGNKNDRGDKMWKCVKNNYPPNKKMPYMDHIGKVGSYDLAILNSNEEPVHLIEVKLLKDQGFNDGDRHRAYEDIYVLSEELLGKEIHSSLFVLLRYSRIRKDSEIQELFGNIEATFKNAGLKNFESYAFQFDN